MNPPSSSASRSKQARLKPEMYLPFEDLVCRLYLEENKTTQVIAEILEREMGTTVTNSQVIHLVNKVWSLRKRLTPSDHKFIDHVKRKRQDEGKLDTRIKLCGVVQDEERLARKKARVHEPTFQKFVKAQNSMMAPNMGSPMNPPGLEVGTPTPRPISEFSPMAFARSPQNNSPPFYFIINHLYEGLPSLKLEIVFQKITTKLQGAPTPVPFSPGSLLSMSKTPALLSIPGTSSQDLNMSLIVNQEGTLSEQELLEVLQPLVVQFGNRASNPSSLRDALDGFTESDISPRYYTTLQSFFNNATPIIDDFAVQTFYSAARTGNINLLRFFIELGILKRRKGRWSANSQVIGVTALQFSIEYRQGISTSLLLRSGIDINVRPVSDLSQSVLKTAVEVQDLELVNQLLDMGAEDIVFEEIYELSPVRERYLNELEEADLTWAENVSALEGFLEQTILTALFSAISLEDDDIFEALLRNRSTREKDGKPPIPFDSLSHIFLMRLLTFPNFLRGDVARVSMRLESLFKCNALRIDINAIDLSGYTALALARDVEDSEEDEDEYPGDIIVKLLIDYGATKKSPGQLGAPPYGGRSARLIDTHVSRVQLYAILDRLHDSIPWVSYRQSLESLSHLNMSIVIEVLSNSARSFEVKLKIHFDNTVSSGILESMEVVSGSLESSVYFNLRTWNALTIRFEFYSRDASVSTLNWGDYTRAEPVGLLQLHESSRPGEQHTVSGLLGIPKVPVEAGDRIQIDIKGLHLTRQKAKLEACKQTIEFYTNSIPNMAPAELAAFLALAIHCNLHQRIRDATRYLQKLDKISALEATWNGDNTTFDLILDIAEHTSDLGVSLELLTLIAIHIGHTYKVIKLLDQGNVDANYILEGGKTFLETAAVLGRLDITQVLLNAGASHRLPEAKAKAEKFGHFAISHIINEHIKRLEPDTEMATPSDLPTPGPAVASNGPPTDIPTPVPVAAESPRDPIVHEYGLYMSSDGLQEMLSSGSYWFPINSYS
ncbi:hypothetical protein AOL_s00006g235 [Orbilia oligospora ATCC 24927]|uniref:Clr5 domain-containing protein n=1 Tax=Arthrobotrys oligospora (strain ATCC 24927 / CBS 115.81 / DSM 1491) TaxID=756982 RepID=G1X034_ARTOA|nr:hypothetical protein AOL_s00006g235 [Orbilia oligospora ATCC 24927]EGX53369.1 hypothetical protein AOL_s00006g235 [Orbilia oligospora ATCC 24927]